MSEKHIYVAVGPKRWAQAASSSLALDKAVSGGRDEEPQDVKEIDVFRLCMPLLARVYLSKPSPELGNLRAAEFLNLTGVVDVVHISGPQSNVKWPNHVTQYTTLANLPTQAEDERIERAEQDEMHLVDLLSSTDPELRNKGLDIAFANAKSECRFCQEGLACPLHEEG